MENSKHVPVLLQHTLDFLKVEPGKTYVDMTLGGGGHSREIIKKLKEKGRLIAFDVDKKAIERFKKELRNLKFSEKYFGNKNKLKNQGFCYEMFEYMKDELKVFLVNMNFERLIDALAEIGISEVDGIIADLGFSTNQLEDSGKGFSFKREEELDMRMNDGLRVKARDLVNLLGVKQLESMFKEYGDEVYAKRIAKEIVKRRKEKGIETTFDLLKIINIAVPAVRKRRMLRNLLPATRVFQALRIAVNHEFDSLNLSLPQTLEVSVAGSRLVFLSFHSGEDRIVKNFFRDQEKSGKLKIITKKPITPSVEELHLNRKSRSAKLRAAEMM
ncbi:16S rRNA (cytosine(1402)-N(4))-methyltransferase RsmH [Candidatus Dojkabacteria bacterium]|nr:16S rRNA (cytosine(1402)-N(4))-methyltransferase RsmH [Candidatus Dojkabacteria bacterium]